MKPKLKITETVFRDAHQSLLATRMKTKDMLPIAEKMDEVGYHSLEMWGGATFDACLRFLNEDPWERLRSIRKKVKKTKLQMLLRGQNLLGYKHYADDVVSEFVKKAIYNGIDIVRMFDALNDIRNLETTLKITKQEGGHAQCAISYTISPVHNLPYYVQKAKEMEGMGADSICIKDMSGILTPYAAYDLVKQLKQAVNIPIQLHTHYTSGIASMTYMKAIEAGIDVVDTAISPLALGTSQPPTEPIVAALKDTPYDTGIKLELLSEIADYFRPLRDKYLSEGLIDPKVLGVDANTLTYQVPGGMLSNLISQLKQQNKLDKFEEVLAEVPKVREDLGYPPLVTPMSQMVGTQALFNVIIGERYKMVPKEIKDYVAGLYGQATTPIEDEVKQKIIGDKEVMTQRPADIIPPQLPSLKQEMKEYLEQEEDVLSYALFPQVAMNFFKERWAEKYKIESTLYNEVEKNHPV
ncbi:oxaloacetate decarboxylase subunit alpha [Clostridium formicaceticum]|uniref:Methylmalonyl-CoA carboxyltransferase 5S subunit n=1 Tax=Clostridium formicaceticum TaxID=1497 RepID=A0AAC9RLJ2_9CLOT|nr:oxaloacetate decarboxylase subunit alpha [Clostridium formicaceticum]AOY77248.1 oxaloacetate decarboxylase [Clostridium formicaceticum]ARE87782.1 Methylmalonyl-CoA carboxyltransferase 5S subunit [Clostridium formicaceticum]